MKDKLENFDRDLTLKAWNDSLPLGNLNSVLYNHWKKYVPIIYDPEFDYNNPTQLINKELYAKDILFKPMEYFLCGGEPEEVFALLKSSDTAPNVCGKVFKTGQPTYTCIDCAMDGTCVLCSECFQKSEHKLHRYKIFTSSGGGICDCGDVEAWKSHPYCNIHKPYDSKDVSSNDENENVSSAMNETNKALDKLPNDMVDRAGSLLMSTIQYTVLMLTWQDPLNVPDLLKSKPMNSNCVTMLFNDEVHTYEQVINTLCRAIECTHKEAVDFASTVDREGRSPVLIGSSSDCERVRGTIERATSRHGSKSLKVLVFQSSVVAHQAFAFKLLLWINYVIAHSDGLRVLLCNLTTQPIPDEEHSILEHILLHDTQIWKLARIKCHELFLSNMLMYPETKKKLALLFTQHYSTIAQEYMESEHWYDDSVSDVSVQIFTTPSIARYLMVNKNVLSVVIETFIRVCRPFTNSSGKLSFDRTQHNNTFRRAQYILNDLHYLLIAPPKEDEWCDKLRKNFLKGFNSLMNLLGSIQNMDTVVRKTGQHLDFEPEWETAYNLMYKLIPCLTSLEAWAGSDRSILLRCLDRTLRTIHRLDPKLVYYANYCPTSAEALTGNSEGSTRTFRLVDYSVSSQAVSVHLPVTRLMAGLYLHMADYNLCFCPRLAWDDSENRSQSSPIMPKDLLLALKQKPEGGSSAQKGLSTLPYESEEESPPSFGEEITPAPSADPGAAAAAAATSKDSIKYPTPVEILEYPLRALVLTAQVQVGMWRRNGYSLLNQVYLYHNAKWRGQMYDRDIVCTQVAGALITADALASVSGSADALLVHLLDRFNLLSTLLRLDTESVWHHWMHPTTVENEREDLKNKGALYDEFLGLLIVIISERYVLGIGQVSKDDIMEREIIHQLCMGPVSHSELVKSLPEDIGRSPELEKILSKIAVLKKSTDIAAKTKYELKEPYFRNYSPFFYHYTKSEQSKAEEFKKTRKCDTLEERASPPPIPPEFTESFEPLTKLMSSPMFIRTLRVALQCALMPSESLRSHFSTDLQIHQALYLVCLALYEDKRQLSMGKSDALFVDYIQIGDLINPIKTLLNENRLEIFADLTKYTLMLIEQTAELKLQSVEKNGLGNFLSQDGTEPSSSHISPFPAQSAMETDELTTPLSGIHSAPLTPLKSGKVRTHTASSSETACNSPAELNRRKRTEAATARRNKILAQMNEAQKNFIAGNKDLWDSIPSASSSTIVSTSVEEQPSLQKLTGDEKMGGNQIGIETDRGKGSNPGDAMEESIYDQAMSESVCGEVIVQSDTTSDILNVENEVVLTESPIVVLGPHRMGVEEVARRYMNPDVDTGHKTFTCILCQEEQHISITGHALVMAAFVQNSTVVSRDPSRKIAPEDYAADPAYPGADLALGPAALSCGHVMHRDCWQRFYDAVVARERRHALRFRFHHVTFDVERNEFLCPLCQALSNTVLPLLPPLANLVAPHERQSHSNQSVDDEISFVQWLKVVKTIVRMSSLTQQSTEDETSNYKTEWQYLLKTRDLDYILKFFEDEDLPYAKFEELLQPSKDLKDLEISPSILSMLRTFSLTIYTVGLELDPFEDNDRLPVMTWHACAFTFVAADAGLALAGRPLFGSLTSRSRDCLSYLTRFTGVFGTCVKRELVRHHALRLLKLLFGVIPDVEDKASPCLLLDVDPFSFLVRLCFASPFIFADKDTPNAAVIDYGRLMDHFLLRLMYIVQIVQCLVVYQPAVPTSQDSVDQMETDEFNLEQGDAAFLYELWSEMQMTLFKERSVKDTPSYEDLPKSTCNEMGKPLEKLTSPSTTEDRGVKPEATALLKHVQLSVLPFLRCSALYFHFVTDIPYPEGVLSSEPITSDGNASYFKPLCQYLDMPTSFKSLFHGGGRRIKQLIIGNWLQHPKMRQVLEPNYNGFILRYPLKPRRLIELPHDYTELISLAAKFTCPNSDGDESRAPTLCLMCGALLCSQSYCCQTELEVGGLGGGGTTPVGACTAHAFTCGAGTGIFLRIRECQILFLSGRTKGTFYTPPYIDAYGETDQGLRRGNPLFLCNDRYENLQRIWLTNSIPDEIARSLESNPNLLSIDWQHL